MLRLLTLTARAFPGLIGVGAILACLRPRLFAWFIEGGLVAPSLSLIMLAMGLSLELRDFRLVLHRPLVVLLGVGLQFTIMPALGFLVGSLLSLPPPFAAGLVLVCCCPGGTASNVIAYLARADVALSVTMTAVSTLLAALLTPFLTTLLVGSRVAIDSWGLYAATFKVVLIPVGLGILARRMAPRTVERMAPAFPALAVILIVLIVSGVVAVQREAVLMAGGVLLLAVVLTHGLAFALAYLAARVFWGPLVARTISIEVGMQNSGLGVVLARSCFADPLVAVTPAISAVVHCIYGSALAATWGRRSFSESGSGDVKEQGR